MYHASLWISTCLGREPSACTMPVIGHAFVGIITAHEFEPGGLRHPQTLRPLARALWVPALVALACLPAVATQLGR